MSVIHEIEANDWGSWTQNLTMKSQESEVLSIIRYRGTSKIAGQLYKKHQECNAFLGGWQFRTFYPSTPPSQDPWSVNRKCSSVVNFKVSIIKLSLLINYETSCDKLHDLNIIKYYLKNKVQLFVVFILP